MAVSLISNKSSTVYIKSFTKIQVPNLTRFDRGVNACKICWEWKLMFRELVQIANRALAANHSLIALKTTIVLSLVGDCPLIVPIGPPQAQTMLSLSQFFIGRLVTLSLLESKGEDQGLAAEKTLDRVLNTKKENISRFFNLDPPKVSSLRVQSKSHQ